MTPKEKELTIKWELLPVEEQNKIIRALQEDMKLSLSVLKKKYNIKGRNKCQKIYQD